MVTYKTKLLSVLEYRTPAIYHSSETHLQTENKRYSEKINARVRDY